MLLPFKGQVPQVHPDAWVADSARVTGDVQVAAAASLFFGVVARGDTSPIAIGRGTNIQDNCVLHADPGFPLTIGEDCTVGHRAIVHGCTVGNRVLIGMGAIILNGAVIEDECIIGAGALVTEGKHIPRRSLVLGMPGKVVREVSEEEAQRNLKSALGYQARVRQYKQEIGG